MIGSYLTTLCGIAAALNAKRTAPAVARQGAHRPRHVTERKLPLRKKTGFPGPPDDVVLQKRRELFRN